MEQKLHQTEKQTIIITGPESTGKTKLAKDLAIKFEGKYIPEFARDYVLKLNRKCCYGDICNIAEEQKRQFYAEKVDGLYNYYFLDTYLIITKIWMKWHSNKYEKWIDKEIEQTRNCLYLLCEPDIRWVADGVRENGGEARKRLFDLYRDELERYNLNYRIVNGYGENRITSAINAVNEFLIGKEYDRNKV